MVNEISNPLVSIIMPTYNRAVYMIESVKSVINQTYQNWELIIIDDGSDDATPNLIEGIAESRLRYYREIHEGVDQSRNKGLRKAQGHLIALMDSDDLWAPSKLDCQVKALQKTKDASFCVTGGYNFRDIDKPLSYFYKNSEGLYEGNLFPLFFRSELNAVPSSLIFKKDCLNATGFFKQANLSEVYFLLDLAQNFRGLILYETLIYRRLHESNFSILNNVESHYHGIRLIKSYKKKVPKHALNRCLFDSHIRFGETCFENSRKLFAIRQFLKAWQYKPLSMVPLRKIVKTILA